MRMPGFVAEASLSKPTGLRAARVNQRAASRGSQSRRNTIAPQGPFRVEKLPSRCHQSCSHDVDAARRQCWGQCAKFVGAAQYRLVDCFNVCTQGKDYVWEGLELPGPPELKPGYCDRRCLRVGRVPPVFARL